jgi:hypothetical protein
MTFDAATEKSFGEIFSKPEIKKIKVGDVFNHPDLGNVKYIRPDRKYGLTCELVLVNGNDNWPRYPSWHELYDLGFDLEI